MKNLMRWLIPMAIAGLVIFGCSPRSAYEKRLKKELASGVRNDSLFMGFYLGMTDKDFYTRCWNLNSEGLIKQGTRNTTVERTLRDELNYPATMDFYPTFQEGKITEMPVRYVYNGWAPWNKKLSSDSLQLDLLNRYEATYGKGFITVEHPVRGKAFVKIDGNRRITIFKENEFNVWVVFKDMLAMARPEEDRPGDSIPLPDSGGHEIGETNEN